MTTKICPICGKEFEQHSNNQKYCSEKCRRMEQSKKPYRRASIKKHTYSWDLRNEVYEHFGRKCAICGWEITTERDGNGDINWSHGCEIHHIIPARENGDESGDNLILLCPNCHQMADYGVISREELQIVLRKYDDTELKLWGKWRELNIQQKQKVWNYMNEVERENEETKSLEEILGMAKD